MHVMCMSGMEEGATIIHFRFAHAISVPLKCEGKLLQVCTCNKCPTKEIKCEGKPYQTRLKLDCEFHALLYEIECMGRASQASRLVPPVLKRGHSNLVEASHNVFIRFRSKDISLERLHYHLSTNLGLPIWACFKST